MCILYIYMYKTILHTLYTVYNMIVDLTRTVLVHCIFTYYNTGTYYIVYYMSIRSYCSSTVIFNLHIYVHIYRYYIIYVDTYC